MAIEEEFRAEIPQDDPARYYEVPDITVAQLVTYVEKSIADHKWQTLRPLRKPDAADIFNRQNDVGVAVHYKDTYCEFDSNTISAAQLDATGNAFVHLDGLSGRFALENIAVIQPKTTEPPPPPQGEWVATLEIPRKHTLGPWNVFHRKKYNEWCISVPANSPDGMRINLFSDGIGTNNPEADAHLIAAAPETTDALRDILRAIDDGLNPIPHLLIVTAKAAIAKAEGNQTPNTTHHD